MKDTLRKLFAPVLQRFETGETEYVYRDSYRGILKILGFLFLSLSAGSGLASVKAGTIGGLVPVLVFFFLGVVCEIVAFLGSDRAVANIWKSK